MPDWLNDIAQWLIDTLLWVPRQLWQWLTESLSDLINAIPVPDFIADAATYFAALGPGSLYLMDLFQLPFGIPLILAAYLGRFLIRRLPVVG